MGTKSCDHLLISKPIISRKNAYESVGGMQLPIGNSLDKVNIMNSNLDKFYALQRSYLEKLRSAFMDVQNKGSNNQNVSRVSSGNSWTDHEWII